MGPKASFARAISSTGPLWTRGRYALEQLSGAGFAPAERLGPSGWNGAAMRKPLGNIGEIITGCCSRGEWCYNIYRNRNRSDL